MMGSICGTEASQSDPQVARQAGTVAEGRPAKTARGAAQHRSLGCVGADGCDESMRECEEKESRVE